MELLTPAEDRSFGRCLSNTLSLARVVVTVVVFVVVDVSIVVVLFAPILILFFVIGQSTK